LTQSHIWHYNPALDIQALWVLPRRPAALCRRGSLLHPLPHPGDGQSGALTPLPISPGAIARTCFYVLVFPQTRPALRLQRAAFLGFALPRSRLLASGFGATLLLTKGSAPLPQFPYPSLPTGRRPSPRNVAMQRPSLVRLSRYRMCSLFETPERLRSGRGAAFRRDHRQAIQFPFWALVSHAPSPLAGGISV
jgi:hypothetical protein